MASSTPATSTGGLGNYENSPEIRELNPPQAAFALGSQTPSATTVESAPGTPIPNNSAPLLSERDRMQSWQHQHAYAPQKPSRRRPILFLLAALVGIGLVVVAVVVPVYFTVIKPKQNHSATAATATSSGSGPASSGSSGDGNGGGSSTTSGNLATTGSDGSTVTTSDGTTFTYRNQFGGFWVDDPKDPFNNNAQPNSWTPPLNTSWTWGKDRVFGVNLGGLFVLEPFISPALFQKYPGTVDEWTLSEAMAADTASGGLNQLEDHYNTFVTEQDIAEIASAGLNWVRLPIPFWAIDIWPGEPFLEKTAWKYIVRLLGWCRKYGIRVNLDLHTIPGSQNGYNHSGKLGQIDWLYSVMGLANAQRSLNYIRIITEFISQPEWKDVVPVFSIVNEALLKTIGKDVLTSFYIEAHNMIREITGIGAGNGPFISIHDGFQQPPAWAGFLPDSDRIILDTHPYFAFDGESNTQQIATSTGADAGGVWPAMACNSWGANLVNSQTGFGVTFAGEFSAGYNDCGLFLRGVGGSALYGDCSFWQDASTWNDTVKAGLQAFTEASMDALGDWFFWTWKIGNSTAGIVESPLWSYQAGFEGGWIPQDPRTAKGKCAQVGVTLPTFDGTYQPWQTGGGGGGQIAATATQGFPWPPPSISGVDGNVVDATSLPTYTPTGTVATLPPPTFTAAPSVSVGNGWVDPSDSSSAYTAIDGCTYPDAWDASTVPVPATVCGGGATPTA